MTDNVATRMSIDRAIVDFEQMMDDIRVAEIVVAVDERRGEYAVVFGKDLMDLALTRDAAKIQGKKAKVLKIPINFATDELQLLCMAVECVHGRHEYVDGFVHN